MQVLVDSGVHLIYIRENYKFKYFANNEIIDCVALALFWWTFMSTKLEMLVRNI